ncbi:hypothetical protein HH212_17660 [Massilia forsythiae]|uniref:Uncharacterized protein n=1 Tax=Massilia forsythiae TaxID=2728020 RepID=A0A7Z2VZ91_9BURK|nr:hypothetical protein [Massilia forsythiae]QJE01627.1 hypothetical protein HH212_17660 [Massilia forsythiae]
MYSLVDACHKYQLLWYFSRFLPRHRVAFDRTRLTNFSCCSDGNSFYTEFISMSAMTLNRPSPIGAETPLRQLLQEHGDKLDARYKQRK